MFSQCNKKLPISISHPSVHKKQQLTGGKLRWSNKHRKVHFPDKGGIIIYCFQYPL